MTIVSIPPSDPAVNAVFALITLLADPEATKAKLQEFADAKAAADAVSQEHADAAKSNAAEAERLHQLSDDLLAREATLAPREKQIVLDLANVSDREAKLEEKINAHDSAVKQANTDASVRDSALGVREQAVSDRETAATEALTEAETLRAKYETALENLQAIVRA